MTALALGIDVLLFLALLIQTAQLRELGGMVRVLWQVVAWHTTEIRVLLRRAGIVCQTCGSDEHSTERHAALGPDQTPTFGRHWPRPESGGSP